MRKIYLATPYGFMGGKGPLAKIVQWWRFRKVTRVAAHFIERRINVFSPITMTHPIGRCIKNNPLQHSEWLEMDYPWLDHCDELWVYKQWGWEKSEGVELELGRAVRNGIPIEYFSDKDLKLPRFGTI